MSITFGHTNIIATDWKLLASFYKNVFSCIEVPPQRSQSGKWLEEGTGVANAQGTEAKCQMSSPITIH